MAWLSGADEMGASADWMILLSTSPTMATASISTSALGLGSAPTYKQ
jgi:hypothetical protein